jgi:hypothetical protein
MKNLILSAITLFLLTTSCQTGNQSNQEQSKLPANEPQSDNQPIPAKELKTKTGKVIIINETHPDGLSMSKVQIVTQGFKENQPLELGETDPVQRAELADLDNDGFDELYVFTQSAGSGSGGEFYIYASLRDEKLIKIEKPVIDDKAYIKGGILEGYMGHDQFSFDKGMLIREFPVYKENDSNDKPTGGTKRISYKLKDVRLEMVK